jgi:hypothetical protein
MGRQMFLAEANVGGLSVLVGGEFLKFSCASAMAQESGA